MHDDGGQSDPAPQLSPACHLHNLRILCGSDLCGSDLYGSASADRTSADRAMRVVLAGRCLQILRAGDTQLLPARALPEGQAGTVDEEVLPDAAGARRLPPVEPCPGKQRCGRQTQSSSVSLTSSCAHGMLTLRNNCWSIHVRPSGVPSSTSHPRSGMSWRGGTCQPQHGCDAMPSTQRILTSATAKRPAQLNPEDCQCTWRRSFDLAIELFPHTANIL